MGNIMEVETQDFASLHRYFEFSVTIYPSEVYSLHTIKMPVM